MNQVEPTWRWLLKATLGILWAFLLVGSYFWAHKPFDFTLLAGLGTTLVSIAVALLIVWLGAALGWRLGRDLLEAEELPAQLALAAGIGLGLLSLLLWALGMVGLYRRWVAWVLVVMLVILLRRPLLATVRLGRQLEQPRAKRGLQRLFLIFAIGMLSITFLQALTPVVAWDSHVYHLTAPDLYLKAGRIGHPVDLPYLGFPQLGDMHFGLGMLLAGDRVPALLQFGYGLLALAMTAALARRAFGKTAAWFAIVLLLSMPTLLDLMSTAYVDVTLLFYVTAAFYCFLRWRDRQETGGLGSGWLLLAGLFAGFTMGVKYTSVIIPAALAVAVLWSSRHDKLIVVIRRLLLLGLTAFLVAVPWLLENWITTGNPVYPFLFDDALYWDAWRSWSFGRSGTGFDGNAVWRLLTAPLEASIFGSEGSIQYDFTLGPLLLLSLGLLPLVWRSLTRVEKGTAGHLLLFFGLNYVLWLAGLARSVLLLQTRLLMPVFGVAAVLGGVALARLPALRRPQLDVAWIVQSAFALSLVLLLVGRIVSFLSVNPMPVIVGVEAEEEYLSRRLGTYDEAIARINRLPDESKVVFLWEPRSYRCEVECWPDALLDRFLHHTHYYNQDADGLAEAWRDAGFTHVLVYEEGVDFVLEAGFDPLTSADLSILEELKEEYLRTIAKWDDEYALYAIEPGPRP